MNLLFDWKNAIHWRLTIQWLFLGWCIFIGVQFGLFVRHFETFGQTAYYSRPPSVEGFLPIGALISLKSFLVSGQVDFIHPAALVLLVTFLTMALLAKKSFCSFVCPVGTLSESLWKLGQKVFGRNFRIYTWLDYTLQALKYGLLVFFLKMIIIDMSIMAVQGFLQSPYWAVADVKMLAFFTNISKTSLFVISILILCSIPYRNFWCRYLCPYGALLGLLSFLSPFKVFRNNSSCSGCGACSRACPSLIDVQHKTRVYSPECTGCMTCINNCPETNSLSMGFYSIPVSGLTFVSIVLTLFASGVMLGMVGGYWETILTYEDYRRLIPVVEQLGF